MLASDPQFESQQVSRDVEKLRGLLRFSEFEGTVKEFLHNHDPWWQYGPSSIMPSYQQALECIGQAADGQAVVRSMLVAELRDRKP